jgi:hypothetical protein
MCRGTSGQAIRAVMMEMLWPNSQACRTLDKQETAEFDVFAKNTMRRHRAVNATDKKQQSVETMVPRTQVYGYGESNSVVEPRQLGNAK